MTTTLNGREKKSLSHQLDRLDSILEGLSEALQEAVADAVKDAVTVAVKEAVEAAVAGLAAHPELIAPRPQAKAETEPEPEPTPTKPAGDVLKERWFGIRKELKRRWNETTSRVSDWWVRQVSPRLARLSDVCHTIRDRFDHVRAVGATLIGFVRQHRRDCTASALVGLVLAILGYFGGPELAALIGGVAGGLLALAGTVLFPLIRMIFWIETPRLPEMDLVARPGRVTPRQSDSV